MRDTGHKAVRPVSLSGFGTALHRKRRAVKVTWAGVDWDDEEDIMKCIKRPVCLTTAPISASIRMGCNDHEVQHAGD